MLTSISEERIPRLWEYPFGGRSWERARSPRHALGAGEAPPTHSQRGEGSPGAPDKTPEGEAGLAEAGDAEAREGNRSNHALRDPDSGPGEEGQFCGEQNIVLTATSAADAGESVESGTIADESTCGLEHGKSSHLDISTSKDNAELDQFEPEALAGTGACSGITSLDLEEENKVQSKFDLRELGEDKVSSVMMEEENTRNPLQAEPSTGNGTVEKTDESESLIEVPQKECEILDNRPHLKSNDEDTDADTTRESVCANRLILENTGEQEMVDSFARENETMCSMDICKSELTNNVSFGNQGDDGSDAHSVRANEVDRENLALPSLRVNESSEGECVKGLGSIKDGHLSKEPTDAIPQPADMGGDTEIQKQYKESVAHIEKTECFNVSLSFCASTGLKDEVNKQGSESEILNESEVVNRLAKLERGDEIALEPVRDDAKSHNPQDFNDQDRAVDFIQDIEQNRMTEEYMGGDQTSDKVYLQLKLSANKTEISHEFETKGKSVVEKGYAASSDAEIETIQENLVRCEVSNPGATDWDGKHQKESCVEEPFCIVRNDDDDDMIGYEEEQLITSVHATGSMCHSGSEQIMSEAAPKEIVSQEDSIISASGSSRAKGSGSDSMVAEGTLNGVDSAGARESHSDHTSCSDKVDQTAKAKDGSTKPRGRERERAKRKRVDREDRDERGGSTGGKQKSLKNAVGDVNQAETGDAEEAATEDLLQAKGKNSQGHDLMGRESRTIRATSSGDVRESAVKSTCGLESQTVTSLDDPSSETVESASLWEQEQAWEESDTSARSYTSPKGVPASRFGKRTQLHRQKQGSPQGQTATFPDTDKSNGHMNEMGLGDSEIGSTVKTVMPGIVVGDNLPWVPLVSGSNTGQDESCNNPVDPISAMESSDNGHEVEVRIDENPTVQAPPPGGSQTRDRGLHDFEHGISQSNSEQLAQAIDKENNWSEKLITYDGNGILECSENKELNPVGRTNENELDSIHIITEWNEPDRAETNKINVSELAILDDISGESTEKSTFRSEPINVTAPSHPTEDNSKGKVEDGAVCCSNAGAPDQRSTVDTVSTLATSMTGDTSARSNSASSGSTAASSQTAASGYSSVKERKRKMSNFDSLFPPMSCVGGACFPTSEPPVADTDAVPCAATPSGLPTVSPFDSSHGVKFDTPGDILDIADPSNTSQSLKSDEHATIISDELQSANYYDQHSRLVSKGGQLSSDHPEYIHASDVPKKRPFSESFEGSKSTETPEEHTCDNRAIELVLSDGSDVLIVPNDSKNEEPRGVESEDPSEGLHIAHVESFGDDLEGALVSALAEAAQDCLPPLPNTLDNSGQDLKIELDTRKNLSKTCEETYKERHSLSMKTACMTPNNDSCTVLREPVTSKNEKSGACVSKTLKESFRGSTESNNEHVLQEMAAHHNEDPCGGQIRLTGNEESRKCDGTGAVREKNHENTVCLTGESGERASMDPAPISKPEAAEANFLVQNSNFEVALDQGDYPVSEKGIDDALCQEYQSIQREFIQSQENKLITEPQIMMVLQRTTSPTSPFPQRRPHTPVAGDGDWGEKEESDIRSKSGQAGCNGESEGEGTKDILPNEHCGAEQKLISSDLEVTYGDEFLVRKSDRFKPLTAEPGQNGMDLASLKNEHIVEDSENCASVIKESALVTVEVPVKDADKSTKVLHAQDIDLEVPYEISTTDTRNRHESLEQLQETVALVPKESKAEIKVTDLAGTNTKEMAGVEDDASQVENTVKEMENIQTDDKEDDWADMVIGEIDRVCDEDQQHLRLEEVGEHRALPILPPYRDTPPTLEELAMFPEPVVNRSYGRCALVDEHAVEKSMEPTIVSVGRSKDGGKRAKRSKPCEKQQNTVNEGQPLLSEGRVRRITVVDVAHFPKDTPCVYHPEMEDGVNKPERIMTRREKSKEAAARGKKVTLWRRLKTIFHPRRLMSKEKRAATSMQQTEEHECPPKEETVATSLPPPIIHLRQPAKSDDTLGVTQEQGIRDAPSVSLESWPSTRHKIKVRPPGHWRRLKKFRALRQSAEKRGGRRPATMRQVVSKNNFVREADGDHPSSGRHGAGKTSQRNRRFSPDLPLMNQQHSRDMTTRSTPEVTQVFKEGEDINDEHFNPDEPTVRLLLKPTPVTAFPSDSYSLPPRQSIGDEEFEQRSNLNQEKTRGVQKGDEFASSRSAFHCPEGKETAAALDLRKEKIKASTYHGKGRVQTSIEHGKDKANTYQGQERNSLAHHLKCTQNEVSKTSKNCQLM